MTYVPPRLRRALDIFAYEAKVRKDDSENTLFDYAKAQLLDQIKTIMEEAVVDAIQHERQLARDAASKMPRYEPFGYLIEGRHTYEWRRTRVANLDHITVYREVPHEATLPPR